MALNTPLPLDEDTEPGDPIKASHTRNLRDGIVEVDTDVETLANIVEQLRQTVGGLESGATGGALSIKITGNLSTAASWGQPGLWFEKGFSAMSARVILGTAPAGSDASINILINGVVQHTFTIPAGSTDVAQDVDFIIPDRTLVKFAVTAVGSTTAGANTVIVISRNPVGGDITEAGTVSGLVATPSTTGVSLVWDYSSTDNQLQFPSSYIARYMIGTVAPSRPTEGTAGPNIEGGATSATISGLSGETQYSVSVFPMGMSGTPGRHASTTFTTSAGADTTPPGTISDLSATATTNSITLSWTNPTDPDFRRVIVRRANNMTTIPSSPTDNRPAGAGMNATGAGLYLDAPTDTFTDGGLTSSDTSMPFAYGVFTEDVNGNVNSTPVGIVKSTLSTTAPPPTSEWPGAGYTLDYNQDFSGTNPLADMAISQFWKQQKQGPTASSNIVVADDPLSAGNKVMEMRMRRLTGGWFKPGSTVYSANPGWADGVTDGTGWYGSRFEVKQHHITYGALEARMRAVQPANNSKGGTFMWYPTVGSLWPEGEFDLWEMFSESRQTAEINMHYDKGDGKNQQAMVHFAHDCTQWTIVRCIREPDRVRVWYNNTLRFDSDTFWVNKIGSPGVPDAATAEALRKHFIPGPSLLLKVTCAVAYNGYSSGATFAAGTGTAANQRQPTDFHIDYIKLWRAN